MTRRPVRPGAWVTAGFLILAGTLALLILQLRKAPRDGSLSPGATPTLEAGEGESAREVELSSPAPGPLGCDPAEEASLSTGTLEAPTYPLTVQLFAFLPRVEARVDARREDGSNAPEGGQAPPPIVAEPVDERTWRFDALAAGTWIVRASAPGCVPDAARVNPAETEGIYLQLLEAIPLSGLVLTDEGLPIAGATVVWRTMLESFRQPLVDPERTTITDNAGRFHFEAVMAGGLVEARADGFGSVEREIPALPQEIVLRLASTPTLCIRGRVVEVESGAAVPGAEVYVNSFSHLGPEVVGRSDPGGRFEILVSTSFDDDPHRFFLDIGDGVSTLVWAKHKGLYTARGAKVEAASLDQLSGRTVDGLTVEMRKTHEQRFRVADAESREAVPDASISLELYETDDTPSISASGKTDGEGEALIPGLRPGRGRAAVSAPDYLGDKVDLELTGAEPDALEIVLRRGGAVAGRVISPDGHSLAGATVRIAVPRKPAEEPPSGHDRPEVTTDGEGRYRIDGLPGYGEYVVCARAPAYRPGLVGGVAVETGKVTEGVEVWLVAGGAVAGTVRDEDGRPLSAGVGAERIPESPEPRPKPEDEVPKGCYPDAGRHGARADDDGRYEIGGLPPGRYRIRARASGHPPLPPREVTVPEGQRVEGIHFLFRQGFHLEGSVTDTGGSAIAGAELTARPTFESARTGLDGRFRLEGLPAGRFILTAKKGGYDQGRISGTLPSPPLRLVLERQARLLGRIVRPDGSGTEGFIMAAQWKHPGGWRMFEPKGDVSRMGWFDLSVPAGDLAFVFRVPECAEVRRDLRLAPGEVREMRVVMGPGGVVACRVVDAATGAPVPEAHAALYDEAGRRLNGFLHWLSTAEFALGYDEGRSRSDGTCQFDGVPGGEVIVAAWHPERGPARKRLRVEGGREHAVTLELPGGSGIHGLLERRGLPAPDVRLFVCESDNIVAQPVRTQADGSFVLAGLDAGFYDVTTSDGAAPRRLARAVEVAPGSWRCLRLELESCLLHGRVFDAAGEPLAGASVGRCMELVEDAGGDTELPVETTTDAAGRYSLRLIGGTGVHMLSLSWKGSGEERSQSLIVEIPPAQNEWEADLRLADG